MPRHDLKAYTSVIARLPQALADAVKQYASQHRCSVSELVRDGLQMRLEAGEVPGRSTGHHGEPGEKVLHEVLQGITEVLQAVKALAPMGQAAVRQTITEVLHEVLPRYISRQQAEKEGHTEVLPLVPTILQPATEEGMTEGIQGHTEVLPLQTAPTGRQEKGHTEVLHAPDGTMPATGSQASTDVDATRYDLGKLCPQGHDYHASGMSLRYQPSTTRGGCVACDAARARERRKRRRTAAAREGSRTTRPAHHAQMDGIFIRWMGRRIVAACD